MWRKSTEGVPDAVSRVGLISSPVPMCTDTHTHTRATPAHTTHKLHTYMYTLLTYTTRYTGRHTHTHTHTLNTHARARTHTRRHAHTMTHTHTHYYYNY